MKTFNRFKFIGGNHAYHRHHRYWFYCRTDRKSHYARKANRWHHPHDPSWDSRGIYRPISGAGIGPISGRSTGRFFHVGPWRHGPSFHPAPFPKKSSRRIKPTLGENGRWAGTPFRGALFNLAYPGLRCACPGLHAYTPLRGWFLPCNFFLSSRFLRLLRDLRG